MNMSRLSWCRAGEHDEEVQGDHGREKRHQAREEGHPDQLGG